MFKRLFTLFLLIALSAPLLKAQQKEDSIDQLRSTVQRLYAESKMDSLHILVPPIMQRCLAENRIKEYYEVWDKLIRQYHFTGLSERGLTESRTMLKYAQANKSTYGQAIATRSLGMIMAGTGNTTEGKNMMQRAIALFSGEPQETLQLVYTIVDLIDILNIEGNSKQVLLQCNLLKNTLSHMPKDVSAKYASEIETIYGYEAIYRINALCEQNRMHEANTQLKLLHEKLQKRPNELLRQALFQSMMFYYNQIEDYPSTLQYIDSALESYRQSGYIAGENMMLRNKAEILSLMKDFPAATKTYKEYVLQHDSTTSADMSRQISELNAIYDVNRLTELTHEQELKSQQTFFYVSVGISLLLIVIVILGIMVIRRFKRLNNKLSNSESKLLIALDRAENAARMRQTFIQNMTHEIRTPLNSIVGFSQVLGGMLEGKPEGKELQEFTHIINQNSDLLLRLVGDVLDLSELDSEDTLFKTKTTDIYQMYDTLIDMFQWKVNPGVKLRMTPKQGANLLIETNEPRLQQLFTKLLNNAVKFTHEGTITLEYSVNEQRNRLHLSVTDTGCGIPEEQQEFIFDRFVKGNDYIPETGLGLPICGVIAMRLGGEILLDKEYTDGCRFTIILPLKQPD